MCLPYVPWLPFATMPLAQGIVRSAWFNGGSPEHSSPLWNLIKICGPLHSELFLNDCFSSMRWNYSENVRYNCLVLLILVNKPGSVICLLLFCSLEGGVLISPPWTVNLSAGLHSNCLTSGFSSFFQKLISQIDKLKSTVCPRSPNHTGVW